MNQIPEIKFPDNFNSTLPDQQKDKQSVSFQETLSQFLQEVNDLQKDAKQTVEKAVNGEINDVHQVMIAAEKASVGLELTLAIRNKLLDAYREIMRMQG